jgi:predicted AAA+ superfamily ATPase
MIERTATSLVTKLATQHPTLTISGPRQSGKTTLCRAAFPEHAYVSLERLDRRDEARTDPLGLLARHPDGVIFDGLHHVPELIPYIQAAVEQDPRAGRFILTGAQQLGFIDSINRSLAGRTAFVKLFPPSYSEILRFPEPPRTLFQALWMGSFPAIHDRGESPEAWLADYITSRIESDARHVVAIQNVRAFQTFIRLAAGRTGQVLNLSRLAGDTGVSVGTIQSWLSVLEAGFVLTLLPAWRPRVGKRLAKAPKLHFLDSGIVCSLLGIASPQELETHSARGGIFESWVLSEVLKDRYHRGARERLFHLRTHRGEEVDLVVDRGRQRRLLSIKSGRTVGLDALRRLRRLMPLVDRSDARLVHGGDERQTWEDVQLIPWRDAETAAN